MRRLNGTQALEKLTARFATKEVEMLSRKETGRLLAENGYCLSDILCGDLGNQSGYVRKDVEDWMKGVRVK